jgi:hydrogenase nickel incorporation protein HypB
MLGHALESLDPKPGSVLAIENVGNLVCPAMFDLGEDARVVVFSLTEGEDKPIKYPHMFARADVVLLNKIDLAPHLAFDEALAREFVARVSPRARIIRTSARTGEGVGELAEYLLSLGRTNRRAS